MQATKQEQLAATRRNQILAAAAKVFAKKGFHPTTIKDVAKEAGVADGTIYLYFPNKPALLLGILDRMTDAARQQADPSRLATMDLQEFILVFLQRPLTAFEADNFALFKVIMSEIMVNPDLQARYYRQVLAPTIALADQYAQHWAEHNALPPAQVKLLMHTMSSMVIGLIVQRVMGDLTLASEWEQLPAFIGDLLVNGVRRTEL